MKRISLNDKYELRFYGCDQGRHLVVWRNDSTVRCRKERIRSIRSFLDGDMESLGKGSLTLRRDSGANIQVLRKEERIGTISDDVLESALEDLSSGKLSVMGRSG
ncbi:MAG: hypothetical protein CMJ78_06025 [Planctomycetaceae bacterium]|nr:hypothetical protein [Planctomycetaceae bacterium]